SSEQAAAPGTMAQHSQTVAEPPPESPLGSPRGSVPHTGGVRLKAGRSLFDPAQDRLGTAHVITPGHPLIPPGDPEVGQRADSVTATSRASRARAADDDVERPAREPVLRPAAAQEPHEFLDLVEVRRASALPPCHDGDGTVPRA